MTAANRGKATKALEREEEGDVLQCGLLIGFLDLRLARVALQAEDGVEVLPAAAPAATHLGRRAVVFLLRRASSVDSTRIRPRGALPSLFCRLSSSASARRGRRIERASDRRREPRARGVGRRDARRRAGRVLSRARACAVRSASGRGRDGSRGDSGAARGAAVEM